jgi:hypothetical protein
LALGCKYKPSEKSGNLLGKREDSDRTICHCLSRSILTHNSCSRGRDPDQNPAVTTRSCRFSRPPVFSWHSSCKSIHGAWHRTPTPPVQYTTKETSFSVSCPETDFRTPAAVSQPACLRACVPAFSSVVPHGKTFALTYMVPCVLWPEPARESRNPWVLRENARKWFPTSCRAHSMKSRL